MPTDDEIDTFLSSNIEDLINIFSINNMFEAVVREGDLPQSYLKLYPYINNYNKSATIFEFNFDFIPSLMKIKNLKEISQLMVKLQGEVNDYEGGYESFKNRFQHLLELYDTKQILDTLTTHLADNLYLYTTTGIKFEYDVTYYQNLLNYIELCEQENYLQTHQILYFHDVDFVKFIYLKLNYNFNYFFYIRSIEMFNYLYHYTNFRDFLNQTTIINAKTNLLNYIVGSYKMFEVFKHVVENYSSFNLNYYEPQFPLTIEALKYLINLGYDHNHESLYHARIHQNIDDNVEYLIQFDLSQVNLTKLYIMILNNIMIYHNDHLSGLLNLVYNRIDNLVIDEQSNILLSISQCEFKDFNQILNKLSDVNLILKYNLTNQQLQTILNRYDHLNHHIIIRRLVDYLNYYISDAGDNDSHNNYIDREIKNIKKSIKLLNKHNYTLTLANFNLIMAEYQVVDKNKDIILEYFKDLIIY